jgi:hypothetical protein
MTGAMKTRALLLIGLAACGGKSPTTTPTPTPTPTGGMTAAELWAPVMKQGTIFSFVDRLPNGDEEFNTVEATVAEVKDTDGGKIILLTWTLDGEPLEGGTNLPRQVWVTAAGVRLQPSHEPDDEPYEAKWPSTTDVFEKDFGDWGIYIHDGQLAGERCYGVGPGKDSGECEDVCFVDFCVHPKHGLTGGAGTWWPDTTEYFRRDLAK